MFAALSELSNNANCVIECGSIIRQISAKPITILVAVAPPDIEKISRHGEPFLTPP
jgi:hypothetical protein